MAMKIHPRPFTDERAEGPGGSAISCCVDGALVERAELRHDLSKELRRLYEHYDVIDELAGAIRGEAIFRGPVFSSTGGIPGAIVRGYELSKSPPAAIPPLFSLADVKEFVTRTTAAMHREFPGSAQHEDEISFEAAKFIELEANMAAGGDFESS